jgi:hypothetical protein
MRALTAAARQQLRDAIEAGPLGERALAFVEAVVTQLAHPLGHASRHGDTAHESTVAARVAGLLNAALGDDPTVTAAADDLAHDPGMLAVFFQNLDLLPSHGFRPADAVALLVVMAMSRLEELNTRG